jgi:hypothetical protein
MKDKSLEKRKIFERVGILFFSILELLFLIKDYIEDNSIFSVISFVGFAIIAIFCLKYLIKSFLN